MILELKQRNCCQTIVLLFLGPKNIFYKGFSYLQKNPPGIVYRLDSLFQQRNRVSGIGCEEFIDLIQSSCGHPLCIDHVFTGLQGLQI